MNNESKQIELTNQEKSSEQRKGYVALAVMNTSAGPTVGTIVSPVDGKTRVFDTEVFAKKVGDVFGKSKVMSVEEFIKHNPNIELGDIESEG